MTFNRRTLFTGIVGTIASGFGAKKARAYQWSENLGRLWKINSKSDVLLTDPGPPGTVILPPIFGGDSVRQTFTEAQYEQKRTQALMQLNIPHNRM